MIDKTAPINIVYTAPARGIECCYHMYYTTTTFNSGQC